MSTAEQQAQTVAQQRAQFGRMLVYSIVVGILAAVAGSLFILVINDGQELLFTTLPEKLGLGSAPWWWPAIMLVIGATIVMIAQWLPGKTGEGPLTGFHFDDPPRIVPSVLLAALGTLLFGISLGPEAPLIVFGSLMGALLTTRSTAEIRKAVMFLGGAAAIGEVFGNPFVTAFMILEFGAMGAVPGTMMVPAFIALASGYLVQVGILGMPGTGLHALTVPGLPAYDTIQVGALLIAVVVALGAAIVAVLARRGALLLDGFSKKRAVPALYLGAIVTAVVVAIAQGGFGVAQDQILFSGEQGMLQLVQQTSVTAVVVILVGKLIVYSFALGSGFRGGPIFPATFLGVAVAVLVSLLLPGTSVTPLAAAGIAAAAGGMTRLVATSSVLGALLVGGFVGAVAPFAIFGAVVGFLVRMALDRKESAALHTSPAAPEAASAT